MGGGYCDSKMKGLCVLYVREMVIWYSDSFSWQTGALPKRELFSNNKLIQFYGRAIPPPPPYALFYLHILLSVSLEMIWTIIYYYILVC